jgi:hypothetical protein
MTERVNSGWKQPELKQLEGDMKNGLYKVVFHTQRGSGAGVVVLHDGRLLGGDSMVAYVGSYQQSGDMFTASVDASTHTNIPGMANVFGTPNPKIQLSGKVAGDSATMAGTSPNAPGVSFQAILTFLTA